MNGYERTCKFVHGEPVDRPPFMPLAIEWVARNQGMTYPEFIYEPENSAIREYDAQNHTNLEQTALVYVKENMEIAAAAKALFQHPNTVRYRLSKIQRIMGMEDDPLFAPMLSLTVSLSRILAEGQV